MKKHSLMLVAGIVIAIVAFMAGYIIGPREANAPTSAGMPGLPDDATVTQVSIISVSETASTSPTVTVEYPQFSSLPATWNTAIAYSTLNRLSEFKQNVTDNEAARLATGGTKDTIPMSAYSFIASWQPVQTNSRYMSFIERYDSFSGGANENQEIETFNYNVMTGKPLTLADLFPGKADYLKQISAIAREQLSASLSQASNGNFSEDMLTAGTEPTAENFQDFTFTDYLVTIYFPKYAVAPGSFGEQHVTIPFDAVK
jgi:hypothetical protein